MGGNGQGLGHLSGIEVRYSDISKSQRQQHCKYETKLQQPELKNVPIKEARWVRVLEGARGHWWRKVGGYLEYRMPETMTNYKTWVP